MNYYRYSCLVVGVVLGVTSSVRADEWRAARVWTAGSDRSVWVVAQSAAQGNNLPVNQIWYAGGSSDLTARPQQNIKMPAVVGQPLLLSADSAALHVLYDDLSAYDYFGDRRSTLGAVWREQCGVQPPLAWAGDATEPTLWAIAETTGLTTLPASAPAERVAVRSTPAGRLALLRLRDGTWSRWPMIKAAMTGERFWLAAQGGTLHVFWAMADERVRTATYSDGQWSEPQEVAGIPNLQTAWVAAGSPGLLFIAGTGDRPNRVTMRLYRLRDSRWVDEGVAREGAEVLTVNSNTSGIGVARGQLVVVRPNPQGEVEYGVGSIGPSPSIQFTPLALASAPPAEMPVWEEALRTALLMGFFLAIFWSRRTQMALPAAVPKGWAIAPVWQRVLATLVDFLPAQVLVAILGMPWLASHMDEAPPFYDLTTIQEWMQSPDLQDLLLFLNFGGIAMYGLWCLVWELTTGTTPGKRLFGCRVLGLDGQPMSARQFIVRNIVRMVEFSMAPTGLMITAMTMLMLTRNHQRIGDLLANTIVVGPVREDGTSPKTADDDDIK